jgi:hypothetical protein
MKLKMKLRKWDILYIEFWDSVDHGEHATWEDADKTEKPRDSDMKCYQAGLLFAETKHSIVLISRTDKRNEVTKRYQIPKAAITKLRRMPKERSKK